MLEGALLSMIACKGVLDILPRGITNSMKKREIKGSVPFDSVPVPRRGVRVVYKNEAVFLNLSQEGATSLEAVDSN